MKTIGIFLVSSLAAAGMQSPNDALADTKDEVTYKSESSIAWKFGSDRSFTLAGHRSHASHSSHGSHRSSSGGSYTPRKTPTYTSPPVKNYNSGTSSDTSTHKKSDSTSPSSILPASPATSPKITKINGNRKSFKVLVLQVQTALFAHGYYNGIIDGISGSETSASISRFQLKNGLPVTGRLSDSLLDSLNINTDIIERQVSE
ncbi:MAG: His-Xaa-Ser repeat protein HxsA [Robiginitomaculum sp.]|nr:His-Xaa-Ser repeat protein HxsA [Robiginitomaculum sp.]